LRLFSLFKLYNFYPNLLLFLAQRNIIVPA
jgi:hypothetical protein